MELTNLEAGDKYIKVAVKVYENVLPELKNAKAGEYKINDGFRLLLQEYQTKVLDDDAQFEWHRKNHDVFIAVDGKETFACIGKNEEWFANRKKYDANLCNEFDEDKDIGFTDVAPHRDVVPFIKFEKNDVLHIYPNDLHISQIAIDDKPEKVKKCCFKIIDGHECKVSSEEIEMLKKLLKKNSVEKQKAFDINNIKNVLFDR